MAAIPFTDKEMQKSWREKMSACCKKPRSNAHRLLLFYAVECGLKAVLMKRYGKIGKRTDSCPNLSEAQHNINRILDSLAAGSRLKLPDVIFIDEIKDTTNRKENRELTPGQINQMWRYGGEVKMWRYGKNKSDLLEIVTDCD